MNRITDNRLSIALAGFCVLFVGCFPFYKYVFDVDGVGYAAVAKQYAAGQFSLAVNGYWSPLHSWITIPFIKLGILPEDAFRYSNGLIAIGCLYALHKLLQKTTLTDFFKSAILFTSVIILLHYSFYELAADLLLVFILLLLFNLVQLKEFYSSIPLNMVAGTLGALAYFAKSYAFPFFLLYFILLHFFCNPNAAKKIYCIIAGVVVFLLLSFPWIYALHWKYGEWMIAHGKNNYGNWDLKYRDLTGPLLSAPPYPGSSSIWEDPWKIEQLNFREASLLSILLHQIRIVLFNLQQLFTSLHSISFFSAVILFLSVVFQFKEKKRFWFFLLLTSAALSAGYLLLHIETRFLWSLTFLFLIAGSMLLQKLFDAFSFLRWQQWVLQLIFFGSFLLEPVNLLKDNLHVNKQLYQTTATIRQQSIKGSFTSNAKEGECMVMAYLSGNPFYTFTKPVYTANELLQEIEQQKIRYYFFYYNTPIEKELFQGGQLAKKASQTTEINPGLMILHFY